MVKDIWFGIHVPPEGRNFQEMKHICKTVEQKGFDLLTITDHMMNMRNPNSIGNHPLECWTTLVGLAAVTERIKLGPLVSCYGYRRPTILAKMATTVDIISKGRLIFGIGAGWHEHEFEGFMGRFPPVRERLQGLRETVQVCKQMFTSKRSSYRGKLYHVENVLNSPQPIQTPVPILVGGGGEKVTLKIAAKYADISHFFTDSLETLDHKLAVLKKHCKKVGRNYHEIRKGTSMGMLIGKTKTEAEQKLQQRAKSLGMTLEAILHRVGAGYGTPDAIIDAIQEYVDRGVGLITFRFSSFGELDLFAREVLPQLTC